MDFSDFQSTEDLDISFLKTDNFNSVFDADKYASCSSAPLVACSDGQDTCLAMKTEVKGDGKYFHV